MSANFKLVPKLANNLLEIWFVLPNGEGRAIAWVVFPKDSQMPDNVTAANDICAVLKKRIRKSVS